MSAKAVVKASDSNGLTSALGAIFAEFTRETDAEVKASIEAAGKKSRSYVRANSPKLSGKYSRSWDMDSSSRDGHHIAVIKNRKHWQLTHLLEDGHDSYNQYGGSYGRVGPAQPEHHVQRAYEVGKAELERLLGVKL